MKFLTFKNLIISFFIIFLFLFKIYLNNFLMAENGDTYDFFKISYELSKGNFMYESKRLPLYSLLLTPFNSEDYVFYGRIINNLIYFLSVFFFYKLISHKFSLNIKEKILFTAIFAFNFVIFDNSFFILSDSLLLMLSVLFLYLYEKNYSPYTLGLVAALALNTRFEGALLGLALLVVWGFQKKFSSLFKFSLVFIVFSIPLILRLYISAQTGSTYLDDEVGFTLKYQNIFKALGSLLFGAGGFWLMSIFILDKNTHEFAKNPLNFIQKNLKNIYLILFVLFSCLLILWGFFIRLYSVPIFLSILYFIYIYKEGLELSKRWYWVIIPLAFYLFNLVGLRHFDLAYFAFGKGSSIIISLIIIYILVLSKFEFKNKIIIAASLIVLLNLLVFVEKFINTRFKYYTIVQASEYVNINKLENVAWFDESGVQKWYFKDFTGKNQYFKNSKDLNKWLLHNEINYLMITDEMGYRIGPIMSINRRLKLLEKIVEYKSDFSGGYTVIYKIVDHKLPK